MNTVDCTEGSFINSHQVNLVKTPAKGPAFTD